MPRRPKNPAAELARIRWAKPDADRDQPRQAGKLGGRPRGVEMPCGWDCGARLTAREMREHFTSCPKRPKTGAR